jgi:hypothetical protein
MRFDKKLVNLTDHPINIQMPDGLLIKLKPSGNIARVVTQSEDIDEFINGIPLGRGRLTPDIEGLPEPKENTFYIVSSLVFYMCADREDILVPDTNNVVKGADVRIVKRLMRRW